jgi:curved DNA-binding protein CbpA
MADDWEVLGIVPGASPAEVRARWLALVKQLHPDRHGDPAAAARLAEVNAAYDRLRAPVTSGATGGRDAPGRPAAPGPPPAPAPASTFAVDEFRPVAFEAVLLAAVDVGDVTHTDEPFSLDMWVGGGACHVELVPQAGGSVVSVDCVTVDAGVVAEALAVALAAQGFAVTLGG